MRFLASSFRRSAETWFFTVPSARTGDLLRHRVEGAADLDGARVHQLERGSLRIEQRGQRTRRRIDRRVHRDRGGLQLRHLDCAQDSLRDECERALGCDEQVRENVERRLVVEERIELVAHRVLERKVLLDLRHGFRVAAHAALQLLELLDELRFLTFELRLRIRMRGVDDGAGRQHER